MLFLIVGKFNINPFFTELRNMLLIYSPKITNRLEYIFDLFFTELIPQEYKITSSEAEWNDHKGEKITYGQKLEGSLVHFEAHEILFGEDVKQYLPDVKDFNGTKIFFHTENEALPFDPFATAFYLVARYEEYLPFHLDRHGRFNASKSIAYQKDFLEIPVVHHYAQLVAESIRNVYPKLRFSDERSFSFSPSFNISNAYIFKHKGIGQNTLKFFSFLSKGKINNVLTQLAVLSGMRKDPFDTFERQKMINEEYRIKPNYFFMVGNRSKYDKNVSYKRGAYRNVISEFSEKFNTGVEFSHLSEGNKKQIKIEKERLEKITGKQEEKSRQHYLKLRLPTTYRQLIENGIKHDYSMGYASTIGFRASISIPFKFFDVEANSVTPLIVHPFCMMDTALKYYLKVKSNKLIGRAEPIFNEIKKVKGDINIIFHNESLSRYKQWKNWGDVYENIVRLALQKK